ncbi:MAG: hypothetical protein GX837_04015 [Methanomicrobiales archaeon]|nr:hypothetical protein [Methanomicrobiales archaeon]
MRWLFLPLFIAVLVGTASAVPLLPAEFSGTVTINGDPAPAGTVITARIGDCDCGSLTLATAGVFGGDALFDRRLIVSGGETDAGKTITFFVDGNAAGTTTYTPGTSASLTLAVTKGTTPGSSSGGGSPSGGSFMPATPVMAYTGSGSLQTDAAGAVQVETVITTTDGDASLSIAPGVRAEDRFGNPLTTVSVKSVPPADLPVPGEGETPVGRALQCEPAGATFDPAIEVSFTLTAEEWEHYEAGQFAVRLYNGVTDTWEPLATTVHPATRTITATVPHFTLIALFTVPAEVTLVSTTSPTEPAQTPGPEVSATTVQQTGLPLSWLTALVALAGVALLVHVRKG